MVKPMILLGVGSRHEGERSCLVAASFYLILVGSAVVSSMVADRHPVVERDSKGESKGIKQFSLGQRNSFTSLYHQ